MAHLKKDLLSIRDIDINKLLDRRYKSNKKRVVSTLFLYTLFFTIGCEFKSPEEWKMPGLYRNITVTLANNEFSFEELINDSTISKDSITDVIRLEYPADIDPKGIPDAVFEIDMSSVDIAIPAFGINDSTELPLPNVKDTTDINLSNNSDISIYTECIPQEIVNNLTFDELPGEIILPDYSNIPFFTIKSITANSGHWETEIINNLPFAIDVNFSITHAGNILYSTDPNIAKYSFDISPKQITDSNPETIYLDSTVVWVVNANVSTTQDATDCIDELTQLAGWLVNENVTPGVTLNLEYVWNNIANIVVDFIGVTDSEKIDIDLPSFDGLEIFKAKIDDSSVDFPNKLSIDANNNSSFPIDLRFDFLNLYKGSPVIGWTIFSDSMNIAANNFKHQDINFSESIIANGNPDTTFSKLLPLESLEMDFICSMDSLKDEIIIVTNNKVSLGIDFDLSIENIGLEYIAAVTDSISFNIAESPELDGMPEGFVGIILNDANLEIDLFNEIGIPVKINLFVKGTRESIDDSISVAVDSTEIGYSYDTNHGCTFSSINIDTARTLIKLDKDKQVVEYYCDITDDISDVVPVEKVISQVSNDEASILDLVNFVPDKITISGNAVMQGEGILHKKSKIWGDFILIAPLSFIFSDPITVIPSDHTSLSSMDSTQSEQINTSIIQATLNVKIINATPVGGNVSLLISDSTIFPLFIDSLITGKWSSQVSNFNTSIWGDDSPDSIYVVRFDGSADNLDSKVLEINFFHYELPDTINYFIGRIFDALDFPATDSIDYDLGIKLDGFSEMNEDTLNIGAKQISWIATVEPRHIIPIFNLDSSPIHPEQQDPNNVTLSPFTLQTTNSIDVQAIINILFDSENLDRQY